MSPLIARGAAWAWRSIAVGFRSRSDRTKGLLFRAVTSIGLRSKDARKQGFSRASSAAIPRSMPQQFRIVVAANAGNAPRERAGQGRQSRTQRDREQILAQITEQMR